MEILHLTLKKKWFDMILSGEKKHEYREDKEYWRKRFLVPNTHPAVFTSKPDTIRFTNGYGADKPSFDIECTGLRYGWGKKEWGGMENNLQFVISLGAILETRNIKE
jgi:hypothetical protein